MMKAIYHMTTTAATTKLPNFSAEASLPYTNKNNNNEYYYNNKYVNPYSSLAEQRERSIVPQSEVCQRDYDNCCCFFGSKRSSCPSVAQIGDYIQVCTTGSYYAWVRVCRDDRTGRITYREKGCGLCIC
jgi:hypothetical protein